MSITSSPTAYAIPRDGTLAVTGHRPPKLLGYGLGPVRKLARFAAELLQEIEPERVITGMAQGWDQAVAVACVELEIPYIAAVPWPGQAEKWPADGQRLCRRLLDRAAHVEVVCWPTVYSPLWMQARNEWMVARAEALLALWDGSPGGTANCVKFAQMVMVPVIPAWDRYQEFLESDA